MNGSPPLEPSISEDRTSGSSIRGRLTRARTTRVVVFWLIVALGASTAVFVLFRTDDNPIETIIGAWPVVIASAALYVAGMTTYALSWARLFESDRRALGLGFLISQPIKYLPGGIAQPIGQIALGVEATGQAAPILIAFPVHVLINVVAAATLGAPLLLVAEVPSWVRWLVVLTPLLWTLLDRRWMRTVLDLIGRRIPKLRVESSFPQQYLVNRAFLTALLALGLMFLSFGVLTASGVPGWSILQLSTAFAAAWLVGYVVIPSPAGLGAREAALFAFLGGALSGTEVVGIAAVHRVMTMVLELAMMGVAVWLARRRAHHVASVSPHGHGPTGDIDLP